MQTHTIYHPQNYRTMPWKNGMGHTLEILRQDLPTGEGFAWRLSMADVSEDGEFSRFNGYDRTLLLLEGRGLTLDCATSGRHQLSEFLQAAQFTGEEQTLAKLSDGPVKDFNVISHRGTCTAHVNAYKDHARHVIEVDGECLLFYAAGSAIEIEIANPEPLKIPHQHLLCIRNPEPQTVHCWGSNFIVVQIKYNRSAD